MTQEDKQLLLADLCARLPYGVKILCEGWDSDCDCEFTTVEELIGIDNRFIYTIWRDEKDKHCIKEPLSITDYKPYLRLMSSMNETERQEYGLVLCDELSVNIFDWLNAHHFDYRGLIEKGLAIEVTEKNNPYI